MLLTNLARGIAIAVVPTLYFLGLLELWHLYVVAAVIGIADDRWGEVGHAFIRARPGRSIDADTVRRHARDHLAAYKVPKKVTVLDDFPRTAAGKVRKHILKAENAGQE